mgnify:CR=1 FL=1
MHQTPVRLKMILCEKCGQGTLVRSGNPILAPYQLFENQTFGPTRLTPTVMPTRWPVHCAGRIRVVGRLVRCGYAASLVDLEVTHLLEQIVRRTGRTNIGKQKVAPRFEE